MTYILGKTESANTKQDEIIRMAREVWGERAVLPFNDLERFAALVAAHVKSDQINTAYQQGCEDMKHRMEKRMQQLESQLQLCQTAVADEREECAKLCEEIERHKWEILIQGGKLDGLSQRDCAAAIRARSNK